MTMTAESTLAREGLAILPPVEMADTVNPTALPATWPGAVLAYRDGDDAWPIEQIRRFRRVDGITVTGAPGMAQIAREVDVERYDATPADAPPFLDARAELGHDDGTVYCSRSTLPVLFDALDGRRPRLHIATLDNVPWTPGELADNILQTWHLEIDPAWIWAIQCYPAGARHDWDTSLVYGERDFWDPLRAAAAARITSPYLINEGLRGRAMPLLADLAVFLRGQEDSFQHHLLRSMAYASDEDRAKLGREYPVELEALQAWEDLYTDEGPPTFGKLIDALDARHAQVNP